MNAEIIFSLANGVAMAGWILLIIFPQSYITKKIILSGLLTIILSFLYALIASMYFVDADGGYSTLSSVNKLFSQPYPLLAGWIHYLAFDLLIGIFIINDAQRLSISHFKLMPALVLTFLFGPTGLLYYLALRMINQGDIRDLFRNLSF